MTQSIKLGKISGIPINVHWSFFLIILYFLYEGWQNNLSPIDLIWLVGFILVLFSCVLLHELGHSFAARRYGIGTEDITLLPIGGLARLQGMPKKPTQEMVVAIMGPMVNVVIAALLGLFFWLTPYGFIEPLNAMDETKGLLVNPSNFLPLLLLINITLVLFNCIPAFPMDGGRVLRALLAIPMNRVKATRIASLIGQIFAVGFIAVYFLYPGHSPFLILIGLFIFVAAGSEYKMVKREAALEGSTVRDVMRTQFTELSEESALEDAMESLTNSKEAAFLVTGRVSDYERNVIGFVSKRGLKRALKTKQPDLIIRNITNKNLYRISPDIQLKKVYEDMTRYGIPIMPVYEEEALIGTIDYYQIHDFIK